MTTADQHNFGGVLLTNDTSVLPPDKLANTPSCLDGMSSEMETDLRILGCNLIQTAGKLLRLPQAATATACVLFHRFYYSKSFLRYSMEHSAIATVCLASKVEECPRKPLDVINVFHHIRHVQQGKLLKPLILAGAEYIALKNNVIKAERRVLIGLGFCVHSRTPHKLVVAYLQLLGFEMNRRFVQSSWNFANDSLRTDCCVRYQPEAIACACIDLSARRLGIRLPTKPAWYRLLDVEEGDVRDCCCRILCLYQRKRVNREDLEKGVETLKLAHEEMNRAARVPGGVLSQPATSSPVSQPSSLHRQEWSALSQPATSSPASQPSSLKRQERPVLRQPATSSPASQPSSLQRQERPEQRGRERSASRSQDRNKRKKHRQDRSLSLGYDRKVKRGRNANGRCKSALRLQHRNKSKKHRKARSSSPGSNREVKRGRKANGRCKSAIRLQHINKRKKHRMARSTSPGSDREVMRGRKSKGRCKSAIRLQHRSKMKKHRKARSFNPGSNREVKRGRKAKGHCKSPIRLQHRNKRKKHRKARSSSPGSDHEVKRGRKAKGQGHCKSPSRLQDSNKRKKHRQDRSLSPGSDREVKGGRKEKGRGRCSWACSPIRKSRKHHSRSMDRSRSRDRLSSNSKTRMDRPSDRYSEHSKTGKVFAEKYKKGEQIDRYFHRR
jgi:hypothetical protein